VRYNNVKILLCEKTVKGKIAYKNSLGFHVQVDDFRLKCCTPRKNPKNNISGRKHWNKTESFADPASLFENLIVYFLGMAIYGD
jgi:hypothetical protein